MKRLSLALAILLATNPVALAASYVDPKDNSQDPGVVIVGLNYALASNVGAAGSTTPVAGIVGGSYVFSCTASNWNSATAQLQALGPDGTTYLNVGTALSANGTQGVVIGANATVRVTVAGTPTGLFCNAS